MLAKNRSSFLLAAALLALLLPACLPLLTGHLPWRADGILHLYRQAHFERAVLSGNFYPRWLPDLAYGYGFPLFNYYAPLGYYLALPFSILGGSAFAMRMSYVAAMLLTGGSLYLWAMAVLRDARAGIVAVLAGTYAPYLLVNVHQRGALAEVWGVAFLAFTLAGLDRLLCDVTWRHWTWVLAGVTSLLLVHNITALIAAPILASYALWFGLGAERMRLGWAIAAAICGLGLAAFFWVPALLEQGYVQIERLIGTDAFQWRNHFLSWGELMGVPFSADSTKINPTIPIGYSIPVLLLALPALCHKNRRLLIWLVLIFVALTLMTQPSSEMIWKNAPLIDFVQFPWRFLGPASLMLAMLAAVGTRELLSIARLRAWSTPLFFVTCTCVLLFALPWLFPAPLQQLPDLSVDGSIRYEASSGFLGTTSAADYLPVAVAMLPPNDRLVGVGGVDRWVEGLDSAEITSIRDTPLRSEFLVNNAEPLQIKLNQFYFPGWQILVDGVEQKVQPDEQTGQMTLRLPAGEHTIRMRWTATTLRILANLGSVTTLLLVIGLLIRQPFQTSPLAKLPKETGIKRLAIRPMLVLIAIGISVALAKQVWLNNARTVVHHPNLALEEADHDYNANFGNTLTLIAVDTVAPQFVGDAIDLTLYWTANAPVTDNVNISVHLVDADGRFYGQSDNFRPANFPVPRWQAGEYAIDQHRIEPLPFTPPGNYQIKVIATVEETGQQLELLNENGQPVGASLQLAAPSVTLLPTIAGSIPPENFLDNNAVLTAGVAVRADALPVSVGVGDTLPLTLIWSIVAPPSEASEAALVLADEAGETVAFRRFRPISQQFSLSNAQSGDRWRDPQTLQIPLQTPVGAPLTDGTYTLSVVLENGAQTGQLGQVAVTVPQRSYELPALANQGTQSFGDVIRLAGYETVLEPDRLLVNLAFEATAIMETSYTGFVHLLDENDVIVAQRDAVPIAGSRPTTGWLPPEVILEQHALSLPPDGTYRLAIGFYDPITGDRLGERAILTEVAVGR